VSHLAQAGARSGDEGGDPDFVKPAEEADVPAE